ncbi:hypothetical protein LSTR_LSTR002237 [Laodelphax striatellus]|uniref:Uncharacterized protein n=1 Tax=Laodelphax striatellus TaxID=195883 RepID=A0A482XFI7_LAOST|nr:hypothetical protein LSTR_LSTR002237 [Laodelphax striatellus]
MSTPIKDSEIDKYLECLSSDSDFIFTDNSDDDPTYVDEEPGPSKRRKTTDFLPAEISETDLSSDESQDSDAFAGAPQREQLVWNEPTGIVNNFVFDTQPGVNNDFISKRLGDSPNDFFELFIDNELQREKKIGIAHTFISLSEDNGLQFARTEGVWSPGRRRTDERFATGSDLSDNDLMWPPPLTVATQFNGRTQKIVELAQLNNVFVPDPDISEESDVDIEEMDNQFQDKDSDQSSLPPTLTSSLQDLLAELEEEEQQGKVPDLSNLNLYNILEEDLNEIVWPTDNLPASSSFNR